MNDFKISESELKKAKEFFLNENIDVLTSQAKKINESQPNFSAAVLAFEMNGLNRIFVEDILESIFVVYYVQTEIKKKKIKEISFKDISENIKWFDDFIKYYNMEEENGTADIKKIKFLRDDIVLHFALDTLLKVFGNYKKIPKEVLIVYFAILKGIEIGSENG